MNDDPLAVVPREVGLMDATEARTCLERIRTHWQQFWSEVKSFHDRQGWVALGYETFAACIEQELRLSRSHTYRLLQAAEVRWELQAALAGSCLPGETSLEHMTERHARELARLEPGARAVVARDVDFQRASASDVRALVDQRAGGAAALQALRADLTTARRMWGGPYAGLDPLGRDTAAQRAYQQITEQLPCADCDPAEVAAAAPVDWLERQEAAWRAYGDWVHRVADEMGKRRRRPLRPLDPD
jgi:hypothetical protein